MKKQLRNILAAVTLLSAPVTGFSQAPALGTVSNFVLFTTVGANSNSGITHATGNVGTNSGSSTGYGNVDGQMHDNDLVSGQCAADLLTAYNQLNSATPAFFPAPLLGNGQSLNAGVYSVSGAATLNNTLTLNGQGNANAVFIIQISGPLSTNAGSKVILTNGALACNVFWKVEGLVSLAAGTSMKGNVIAHNAAINMSSGVILEGRALSISGAVTINNGLAYTPVGCSSPVLTGPASPTLASTTCYALFSGNGPVTNTGNTYANGDVGTNVGLTTGFNPLNVTTIHSTPDGSTGACAADLLNVYNYLNTLPADIELLYPAQFGQSLVLTPHTYVMNAAAMLVDTLFLDGAGNANAVFVIQVNGALSTSTYAKVILKNGVVGKNVYWKVDGAVNINDFSDFVGTIICNNGAIAINKGTKLAGSALTTNGSFSTDSINVMKPAGCIPAGISANHVTNNIASIYPNPFMNSTTVKLAEASSTNGSALRVYDLLGTLVIDITLTQKVTTLENTLAPGVYFYKIVTAGVAVQSGKLISE